MPVVSHGRLQSYKPRNDIHVIQFDGFIFPLPDFPSFLREGVLYPPRIVVAARILALVADHLKVQPKPRMLGHPTIEDSTKKWPAVPLAARLYMYANKGL